MNPTRRNPFSERNGCRKESRKILKKLLIILLLAGVLGGGGWGIWRHFFGSKSGQANIIAAKVTRGTFIHEITGKGNAESAKNVDITCQVESAGGVTVIWIIPEGEMVKEEDELVLLDSSDLEDKVNTQQITCNTNAATVASSQASLRTAELSLEEYIEGTFQENWMKIENEIYNAQETQRQAADDVQYTEKLVQFGYTTIAQLDADQVAEQQAINTVRSNLLQQVVLLKYTSEKEITQLMANIETARAKLNSDTYTSELAKSRLEHYTQQLKNCTIRAPQGGQVVYANQDSRRWTSESDMIKEGSTVRERQVLIRLPDPNQMQVKAMINESNIAHVKVGMKAKIAFDALTSRVFDGTVIKVNQYPEISWMSSSKDYVTIVKIDNSVPEIRSGLTAEVKITSQRIEDVLMLPVQCIIEVTGKKFVLKHDESGWQAKEVKLGLSNDKQVIIEAGLEEGEVVVSGARQYKDKVKFPPADEPSLYPDDKKDVDAEKEGEDGEKSAEEGPAPDGSPFANLMKDGKLELAKLPDEMPQMFKDSIKKADKDGDGFLDADEMKSLPKPGGMGGPGGGEGGPGGMGGPGGGEGGPGADRPRERREGQARDGERPRERREGEHREGQPRGDKDKSKEKPTAEEVKTTAAEQDAEKARLEAEKLKAENAKEFARLETLKDDYTATAMELCQLIDEDNSKLITKAEMTAKKPEMVPFFDEWDRNGDGSLTRTDFVIGFCTCRINYQKLTAIAEAEKEAADEIPSESGGMKGLIDKDPNEVFNQFDTDKDGFLTDAEAPADGGELFKNVMNRMDADGDKKVSKSEFMKGIGQLKKMMGQNSATSGGGGGPGGGPPPPPR